MFIGMHHGCLHVQSEEKTETKINKNQSPIQNCLALYFCHKCNLLTPEVQQYTRRRKARKRQVIGIHFALLDGLMTCNWSRDGRHLQEWRKPDLMSVVISLCIMYVLQCLK